MSSETGERPMRGKRYSRWGGGVSHFYGFTALSSVLGHCWQGRDHGDKEAGHAGGRPP